MGGVVFLLGIGAFVLVATWTYVNDRLKTGAGEWGLLAMVSRDDAASHTMPRIPGWRRSSGAPRPIASAKRGPPGRFKPPKALSRPDHRAR